MKSLLPILPRPSRYLGIEPGVVRKEPEGILARVALAFPDLYEVGMSYMGQRILYESVNRQEDLAAERVFAPCTEVASILAERGEPLCSLESDLPLAGFEAVAFSLTHELCYTNVLFMLEAGMIPLKAKERLDADPGGGALPLVLAGGGGCFNPGPAAAFLDAVVIGDGEKVLPEMVRLIGESRREGASRREILEGLRSLDGVWAPLLHKPDDPPVQKAVVADLDRAPFPSDQLVPMCKTVHDRLTLEIGRGCTRGCRFCQAGMLYRPVRERSLDTLSGTMDKGLFSTGFEELSFLSLSTGDYSALPELFARSMDRCRGQQVAISLPSLRVGSLAPELMDMVASIRRTGATIAPEAGSQRLRDVINKNVTEQELVDHVTLLFERGWQAVKLYFMIGLPTETDEDLAAIVDLCRKVRGLGQGVRRLQVTASISPFVPKPHTPFQWEAQIDEEEIRRRVGILKQGFGRTKGLNLKFHMPQMSFLEGIFARGGPELAPVVERAFRAGALFSSWKDHLDLAPYLEAMEAEGLDPADYLAARSLDVPLPWDHLDSGVSREFLLRERKRALEVKTSPDCRFGVCLDCGACDQGDRKPVSPGEGESVRPRLVHPEGGGSAAPARPADPERAFDRTPLSHKEAHYRIWYEKMGPAAYLSQLELQSVFERGLRRAGLPVSFSQGYHPMPRISFGRALSVGVRSRAEWINVFLRRDVEPEEIVRSLARAMPKGLDPLAVERLSPGRKQPQPDVEEYLLCFGGDDGEAQAARWNQVAGAETYPVTRKTKKGERTVDAAPILTSVRVDRNKVRFTARWSDDYLPPPVLVGTVNPDASPLDWTLTKLSQSFS